ncbi:MAG: class I SAM-dependent methyltransferase, partial [Gammaproteobacteria bacterium]|nr:class I SAM-dependent methyltransferase [Gammaproteobacteria bacterium]
SDFKEGSQFLNHWVRYYPEAWSGKIKAISVLVPAGKSDRVKNFAKNMADHSNSQVCMDLLRDMTLMISEKSGKKIRILEVGAGTGDLTWKMASALAGQDVEYYFTDIGKSFVVKAERDAARKGFNFMKCGVLDISSDPAAQGYDTRSFDMIFGLNVVHATKRISETLGHLKTLLVPGGIIALTESIKQSRPVDMVWGVAEGWWYFEDEEIRTETPLMEAEKWEQVMR